MHMPAACGLKHHANQEVQTARNAHGNREGENPRQQNIADGRPLQT